MQIVQRMVGLELMMAFTPKQLRELRAELGLSQTELGRRIGRSHSAVSRLESSRRRHLPAYVEVLLRGAELLKSEEVMMTEVKSIQ